MNTKGLLIVIVLIFAGILGVMAMQYHERQKSPVEKIGEGISDTLDDVGKEIEKATDGQ